MPNPATLEELANRAVIEARNTWSALVDLALRLPEGRVDSASAELSKHMRQTKDNLKRKILAIQYIHSLSHSADEIKAYGQEAVLSRYYKKTNADKYEKTTVMKWNIPGSLREVIRQDFAAVAEILEIPNSEKLWDFMHSMLVDLISEPDALRSLAGTLKEKNAQESSQTRG